MSLLADIRLAEERIHPYVRETPTERSLLLGVAQGSAVFLKLENLQVTGSFKARGALNKLLSLDPAQRARGVVAASSGNHGNAVAYGARVLGCSARIFVPLQADPGKVAAIRSQGAQVQLQGPDCVETEAFARAFAEERGLAYLSPYNDPQVVAGQGTCALELLRQAGPLDALLVALGGGGLIGGMGSVLKAAHPEAKVIACSPERSPAMHACLEAGRIVDVPCGPTLSDGTAGGVEAGSLTFPLCQQVIDRSLLVSEEELREATCEFITTHHMLIEGAAGVALAGYAQLAEELAGQRVGVVICGANIGLEALREVIR